MILIIAALLGLFSGNVHAADVTQKTAGWCSPAVADVKGNVTIICNGVDPRALKRLNELLDIKDKELKRTTQDKIQDAEKWARKYRELEELLAKLGKSSTLARQAKELLQEGKLDEASVTLQGIEIKGSTGTLAPEVSYPNNPPKEIQSQRGDTTNTTIIQHTEGNQSPAIISNEANIIYGEPRNKKRSE